MRHALAVVVGYLAMAGVAIGALTGAYAWLGADVAFLPGSFELSRRWVLISLAIGIVAALVGGAVCAWIARAARAARAVLMLALLLLLAGLAFALLEGDKPLPGPRLGPITHEEALTNLRQPRWMTFALPVVGAVSVLAGGRVGRGRPQMEEKRRTG